MLVCLVWKNKQTHTHTPLSHICHCFIRNQKLTIGFRFIKIFLYCFSLWLSSINGKYFICDPTCNCHSTVQTTSNWWEPSTKLCRYFNKTLASHHSNRPVTIETRQQTGYHSYRITSCHSNRTASSHHSERTATRHHSHKTATRHHSCKTAANHHSNKTATSHPSHKTATSHHSHKTATSHHSHKTATWHHSHKTATWHHSHETATSHHSNKMSTSCRSDRLTSYHSNRSYTASAE